MQEKPTLTRNVDQLHALVFELNGRIEILHNQLLLMKRQQFGPKHESVDVQQHPLFDTDDVMLVPVEPAVEDNDTKIPSAPQEKRSAIKVLSKLSVKVDVIDLPEHEKNCQCCGGKMSDIGTDVTKQIEFIPAQLNVLETHRKKYGFVANISSHVKNINAVFDLRS